MTSLAVGAASFDIACWEKMPPTVIIRPVSNRVLRLFFIFELQVEVEKSP